MKINGNIYVGDIRQTRTSTQVTPQIAPADSFSSVLANEIYVNEPVKFSKHASTRLMHRDISFSPDQMKRLEGAFTKANAKGIKDSLVLVDNVALVVNIREKLVITALESAGEQVFTNIDGAVIV